MTTDEAAAISADTIGQRIPEDIAAILRRIVTQVDEDES